jgi:DEAD/DEAH box helicase
VPTQKQKDFLVKIITGGEECFFFSEVGSGKTKVILPLLCQIFLSNNIEAHNYFKKGKRSEKSCLVIIVPEHLVGDACAQVFRYCLNLNFKQEYKIYDDIFAFMHENVSLDRSLEKKIFITSFNQYKKALTFDEIANKIYNYRDRVMVLIDEVDDFLDRDKLVFNICSNKGNEFKKSVLDNYYEVSNAVYNKREISK